MNSSARDLAQGAGSRPRTDDWTAGLGDRGGGRSRTGGSGDRARRDRRAAWAAAPRPARPWPARPGHVTGRRGPGRPPPAGSRSTTPTVAREGDRCHPVGVHRRRRRRRPPGRRVAPAVDDPRSEGVAHPDIDLPGGNRLGVSVRASTRATGKDTIPTSRAANVLGARRNATASRSDWAPGHPEGHRDLIGDETRPPGTRDPGPRQVLARAAPRPDPRPPAGSSPDAHRVNASQAATWPATGPRPTLLRRILGAPPAATRPPGPAPRPRLGVPAAPHAAESTGSNM